MLRQIVLDTETTGLDPEQGHRIIEIGCVELIDRRPTDNCFQQYLNPDREIDAGALEVHGITNDFLVDKPRFSDVFQDFVEYVSDAELIIHNAAFDTGFLNHEIALTGRSGNRIEDYCKVLDTLAMARQLHPGQRNDLDALCKRYAVDNSQRTRHGALLDAEILADVYLAMTGGQTTLMLDDREFGFQALRAGHGRRPEPRATPLLVIPASAEERIAHERWLERLDQESGGSCLWRRLEEES